MFGLAIEQIVIYVTLLVFLVVGILFKDKPKNMKDYSLGTRLFTKPMLIATMVATLIGGGSTIGQAALLYDQGMLYVIPVLAEIVGYLIFGYLIVPKFKEYYGSLTVVELLSKLYGKSVKPMVGTIAYLFCFGALAMQVKAVGIILQSTIGDTTVLPIILSFMIITIYAAFGGITSVIKTDVVQFIIFMVVLPIIAICILKESGGFYGLIEKIPQKKLSPEFSIISFISLIFYCMIPDDSPDFIHRILIGRDKVKNRTAVYITALLEVVLLFFVIVIASVAITKYQGIDSNTALFTVINGFIGSKIGMMAFAVAMLSVVLSTADSLINTGSIILVNDVISTKIKSEKNKLLCIKVVVTFSGILSLFIALKVENLIDLIWFIGQYYSAIMAVPLIGGLFIKERNESMFWASAITGFVSYTVLNLFWPDIDHLIYVISIFLSLVAYIIASKGTIFYFNMNSFYSYIDKTFQEIKIPIDKLAYAITPLSFFIIITEIISNDIIVEGLITKIIAGVIGMSFLFIEAVYSKNKRIFNLYVIFAIWYCFPFLSSYLYYSHPNSGVAYINMIVAGIFITAVFSWEKIIFSFISGMVMGGLVYWGVYKPSVMHFIPQTLSLTTLLSYIGLISYFIIRPKEYGVKRFIEGVTEQLTKKNKAEVEKALKEYEITIELMGMHELAKRKYKEIRKELDIEMIKNEVGKINLRELSINIENYFNLMAHQKEMKINVEYEGEEEEVGIIISRELAYTIIFSISNFMIGCNTSQLDIKIYQRSEEIYLEYKLANYKFKLEEIEKYITQKNSEAELMSIELIEGIIGKIEGIKYKKKRDVITISMKKFKMTGEPISRVLN